MAAGDRRGPVVRLRRPFTARARVAGWIELMSYGFIGAAVLIVADGDVEGALVALPAVPVRLAVALEYLEARIDGVHWRIWFRRRWARWEDLEGLEIGPMSLFPTQGGIDVVKIRFHTGAVRRMRASVGCRAADRRAWVLGATELWLARQRH